MKTFHEVYAALRHKNSKNYVLLAGCCFFSVLLITAFVSIMQSPTVLEVLPEGGDSRKQVMMIFVLAVIGCGVFTSYAAGLFFRSKARETGVLLTLGAPRSVLGRELRKELFLITFGACGVGALLGTPLALLLWQGFRRLFVDSSEMVFRFDPIAYLFALAFSAFVIATAFVMGSRFLRRTNLMDIVSEARKSEPIREVKRWYGIVGILLIMLGGVLGYFVPVFCVVVLKWYPPQGLTAIFYAPLLIGIYMVLLHTVCNGWGSHKSRYKNIIATSMLKFQGRQTVRNMLVITLLLAGAYFAAFYTPLQSTEAQMRYSARPVDYSFHSRIDQNTPRENAIRAMAQEENVSITDWSESELAALGIDGMKYVEEEALMGTSYDLAYRTLLSEAYFLPESGYFSLTGDKLDVPSGGVVPILDADGSTGGGRMSTDITLITNPQTEQTLSVKMTETRSNAMLFLRYVLDDGDYAAITAGLPAQWRETQTLFNVEQDSYAFAKRLFHTIVDSSDASCEVDYYYDRVEKMQSDRVGEPYWGDTNELTAVSYAQRDSSAFRLYWKYMPEFRVLDSTDSSRTMAVFTMLFVFVAIICFAAVLVIGYTRSLTIALNSAQVYDDLRHLGASRSYLYHAVRGQIGRIWGIPAIVGTIVMYAFNVLIVYANNGNIMASEWAGLAVCLGVVAALSAVIYGGYRLSLGKVCQVLKI